MSEYSQNTILATCKQTRFHLIDPVRSSEVDVHGLTLSITAGDGQTASKKGKSKGSVAALEILVDAHLKLRGGIHYALVGRNGVGKSTLLRALAQKLIPGISYKTKIAVLQQTSSGENADGGTEERSPNAFETKAPENPLEKRVIDFVLESDDTRTQILRELDTLSNGVNDDDDGSAQIKSYRALQLARLTEELSEQQKYASLRSGARGSQARKDLLKMEGKVEDAKLKSESPSVDIDSEESQEELRNAVELKQSLQLELESFNFKDLEKRARNALSGLGFGEKLLEKRVKDLSGGWFMRCMLASALIQDADIMILDEPTNFLDLPGIIWLEKHLADLAAEARKTVIIVSHDRDFVDNVSEETIIIKDKALSYFGGNLSAYEADQRSKRTHLAKLKDAQDRQVAHMEKTISANIRAGKKSGDDNRLRQAVSRQKRLEDRTGLQAGASGARFKLSRDMVGFHDSKRQQIEIPPEERSVDISLPPAPALRFPGALVSLENVTHRYTAGGPDVLRNVTLSVHVGDRVGVVGLNGAGKSTLLKLLTGGLAPKSGSASSHPRLQTGYYSQHAVEELQALGRGDPAATALALLASDVGGALDEGEIRGLLGGLGLPGRLVSDVPIGKLSGGQLARLALARVVWRRPHLLVLDEVTTHLDYYTVRGLCQALVRFDGAVLLVTHDRYVMRYVIEREKGLMGDEDGEEVDEHEVDGDGLKVGVVYRLRQGELKRLERGVQQFEDGVAKRVDKLRAQAGS